jgi:CRISPR system Cascade subunit CasD
MANTLFLRLEGPLQAWGERARWSERDTAPEPTKSGVVGLLGCALGWNEAAQLRWLSQQIRLGIREDKPGVMVEDFHTVVGGVMSAEGKIKITASTKKPETVVTRRKYLCDASFLAAVQSADEALIERLALAVQQPVWTLYLGRKSCPPAREVYAQEGKFSSLVEALEKAEPHESYQKGNKLRVVVECGAGQGALRRDEVDSSQARTFLPRYTQEDFIIPMVKEKEV